MCINGFRLSLTVQTKARGKKHFEHCLQLPSTLCAEDLHLAPRAAAIVIPMLVSGFAEDLMHDWRKRESLVLIGGAIASELQLFAWIR